MKLEIDGTRMSVRQRRLIIPFLGLIVLFILAGIVSAIAQHRYVDGPHLAHLIFLGVMMAFLTLVAAMVPFSRSLDADKSTREIHFRSRALLRTVTHRTIAISEVKKVIVSWTTSIRTFNSDQVTVHFESESPIVVLRFLRFHSRGPTPSVMARADAIANFFGVST